MGEVRQPQQARSEYTRAEILAVALEQFSIRGFDAVSLRDIAEIAGVNHAMIRYYFGNKDALWRESVIYLFERYNREMAAPEAGAGTCTLDAAKNYIRDYVRYCARHPEHARLMMQEANRDSERLKWMAETIIRPHHAASMLPLVQELGRQGSVLCNIDPVMLLYMITAMAQVTYLLTAEMKYAHGIDALCEREIEAHCEAVLLLIFR